MGKIALVFTAHNSSNPKQNLVKASEQLITQVGLRVDQIEQPNDDRLGTMSGIGLRLDPLGIQKVFVYMSTYPTMSEIIDMNNMGIVLYLDSWIPPLETHPYGFFLADLPVSKLAELSSKSYIIRLDSAEGTSEPQTEAQPQ
jgi:hypothetical protein